MNFLWKSKSDSSKSPVAKNSKQNGASGFFPENEIVSFEQPKKSSGTPYSLKEFPRIVEHQFGESLGNRTRLLRELANTETLELGPPDMVHVTLFDNFYKEEIGEYFYITGVDMSSESMPLAFLKMLKFDRSERQQTNESQVSTYCCVNIFRQLDIRIRYESEKSYQVSAVDCRTGTGIVQVNDEIWEETFVSCCLRSVITNVDPVRKLPGLVEYPLAVSHGGASSCLRLIRTLCKFLPRFLECGWDSSRSVHPTVLHNYLTETLLTFLSVAPGLADQTIEILEALEETDPENKLYYSTVIIAVMEQDGERDLDMISRMNGLIEPLLSQLDAAAPRDSDALLVVNCLSEILNLQAKFLIKRGDLGLATSVAKTSCELSSDSFESWFYLSRCYILQGDYERALITINCMPHLPEFNKMKRALCYDPSLVGYYKRPLGNSVPRCDLNSVEMNNLSATLKISKDEKLREIIFGRIAMPNESERGRISEIWDQACLNFGPVYGPHSHNLINFASPTEVKSVADLRLLARSTMAKQLSWFRDRVYELLMEITTKTGWNGLLQLRSKLFVMEKEYDGDGLAKIGAGDKMSTGLKKKRLCERWLDQLFLDLYEDLRISTSSEGRGDVMYNGLEWELLGIILLRTWQWQDAVTCLTTSIMARFDIVSCRKLLELYMRRTDTVTISFDPDTILELLTQKISYESRFYDNFQILNLQVLYRLSEDLGIEIVRNRVKILPFAERGIIALVESMLDWIKEMGCDSR
ncbi:hypothetical protein HG536_0F01500 [Torulaspora globosa]|uniref:Uncharacterized protein n=1 Tax=Torulaspora globosa TaxID=48254 RepID=A0A7G3ZJY9_9SACH|nr:uncharacterized protein HG536_0F01500 [Torulaspora globosa]QLL33825.1 hypothetical protein HG536_0F01500 [Torulaspora globosa]